MLVVLRPDPHVNVLKHTVHCPCPLEAHTSLPCACRWFRLDVHPHTGQRRNFTIFWFLPYIYHVSCVLHGCVCDGAGGAMLDNRGTLIC